MKHVYVKTLLIFLCIGISTSSVYNNATTQNTETTGKVIWLEEKPSNNNETAIIKATETPDQYTIYIKHPEVFFYRDKNPKFMIGSYNYYGGTIYVRHSESGDYIGDLLLPGPIAREFASNDNNLKTIEPVRISDNEIQLVIPKDQYESLFYDWWYGKRGKFYRIDMLEEPKILSPIPPAYSFLMNFFNMFSRR